MALGSTERRVRGSGLQASKGLVAVMISFWLAAGHPAALAENWPQWRGPFFNGSTSETNLPARLNLQEHLLWTAPLPGRSGATPVIWGDSIFLPSPDEDKNLNLLCLDRAGTVRWQKQIGLG